MATMRTIAVHVVTAAMTLVLVWAWFAGHPGSRRPTPLAQIPRAPAPIGGSRAPAGRSRCGHLPVAGGRASNTPPPDLVKCIEADERNNVRVYAAPTRASSTSPPNPNRGLLWRRDVHGHRLGLRHRQARTRDDQLSRCPGGRFSVRVTLFDGSRPSRKIIGADASNDVAVLRIRVPHEKLFPVALATLPRCWSARKSWRWEILSGSSAH